MTRAIEDGDVPNAMHQAAGGTRGEVPEQRLPRRPVGAAGADLDQLVILQGASRFPGDRFGQTVAADVNDGFQGVCAAAKKAALVLGQFDDGHDGDCNG